MIRIFRRIKLEMKMHNPPHPGEVLSNLWLKPYKITLTHVARALGVSRKTISAIVNGHMGISPEMAVRLSLALGTSPESWLNHQMTYDLWKIKQYKTQLAESVKPLNLQAA